MVGNESWNRYAFRRLQKHGVWKLAEVTWCVKVFQSRVCWHRHNRSSIVICSLVGRTVSRDDDDEWTQKPTVDIGDETLAWCQTTETVLQLRYSDRLLVIRNSLSSSFCHFIPLHGTVQHRGWSTVLVAVFTLWLINSYVLEIFSNQTHNAIMALVYLRWKLISIKTKLRYWQETDFYVQKTSTLRLVVKIIA